MEIDPNVGDMVRVSGYLMSSDLLADYFCQGDVGIVTSKCFKTGVIGVMISGEFMYTYNDNNQIESLSQSKPN